MKPAENVVRAFPAGESAGDNVRLPMPQPQRGDRSQPISGGGVTIPPASEGHSHQDLSRRDRDAEIEVVSQRAAERPLRCWNSATAEIEGRLRIAKSDSWYQPMPEERL